MTKQKSWCDLLGTICYGYDRTTKKVYRFATSFHRTIWFGKASADHERCEIDKDDPLVKEIKHWVLVEGGVREGKTESQEGWINKKEKRLFDWRTL